MLGPYVWNLSNSSIYCLCTDIDGDNYITVVPELPDLPGFLEEQTHVCVPVQLVEPQGLAQWVEDTLQQYKADYSFQAKKCKVLFFEKKKKGTL